MKIVLQVLFLMVFSFFLYASCSSKSGAKSDEPRKSGIYNHFMNWDTINGLEACLENPIIQARIGHKTARQALENLKYIERLKVGSYDGPPVPEEKARELWNAVEAMYAAC